MISFRRHRRMPLYNCKEIDQMNTAIIAPIAHLSEYQGCSPTALMK